MKWIALALVLALLSGCSAREPNRLALIRILGVDGGEVVTLCGVCENAEEFGVAVGQDFEAAREMLPWSGSGKELSVTGVSYLVVSETVNLESVLRAVLEDAQLGASATLWVSDEGRLPLFYGCEMPMEDLELLLRSGIEAPTVAQAAAQFSWRGEVSLPRLRICEGHLEFGEMVLWKKK